MSPKDWILVGIVAVIAVATLVVLVRFDRCIKRAHRQMDAIDDMDAEGEEWKRGAPQE